MTDILQKRRASLANPKARYKPNYKTRGKRNQPEKELQLQVARWLRDTYPEVIFDINRRGGYAPFPVRMELSQMCSCSVDDDGKEVAHKLPDLHIMYPSHSSHGLFIEMKCEKSSPYKKNGELRKSEHIQAQSIVLEKLNEAGYTALFCTGFEEIKQTIQMYFYNSDYHERSNRSLRTGTPQKANKQKTTL